MSACVRSCVCLCACVCNLMLQTAVLSLSVLPDDHDVNVVVTSLDSREGLTVHDVGIQVQSGTGGQRDGWRHCKLTGQDGETGGDIIS